MPTASSGTPVNSAEWPVHGPFGPWLRQDRSDLELTIADDVDKAHLRWTLGLVDPPHGDIVLDAAPLHRLITSCLES